MKKTMGMLVGLGLLAAAVPAMGAPTLAVTDTTGNFSGNYVKSHDDPSTPENEYSEGYQQGYVGVYTAPGSTEGNGVVVCSGKNQPGNVRYGAIWVGTVGYPSNQYSGTVVAGVVGYTRSDKTYEGENPTGKSPCQDADPDGVNE